MIRSHLKKNYGFIITFLLLLSLAFFQCYKTTHDLHWAYDTDFDRDMAFVHNSLDGHFGKDPSYLNEYLWYNPLLFSIETLITKISSLPINVVVTQAGTFLNLLCPIAFMIMLYFYFDFQVALAATLSYLFLASGNFVDAGSATYSPWLYPSCFAQFLFYIGMIACYQAFSKQTYLWFFILGLIIGLSFLAHTGPAVLLILIFVSIWIKKMIQGLTAKDNRILQQLIVSGFLTFFAFVAAAFPLLYFIIVKYHFHVINRQIFEYHSELLSWRSFFPLIKANLSIAFFISLIGLIWFYKQFHQPLTRRIFLNFLFIAAFMLVYTMFLPGIHEKLHINLPPTVPSYHYFFYLKALQSVFFGFGFVFIFKQVEKRIGSRFKHVNISSAIIFMIVVLVYAVAYFPIYQKRNGFVEVRELSVEKENKKDKIGVYNYITQNISSDQVILCEEQYSIFPVMATGRKLVCASILFSNPYVDFGQRFIDANAMLGFLGAGTPAPAKNLFDYYHVSYALLAKNQLSKSGLLSPLLGKKLFENDSFVLFEMQKNN